MKQHWLQGNCSCRISWQLPSLSAGPLERCQSKRPHATGKQNHSIQSSSCLLRLSWLIFITHLWISETSLAHVGLIPGPDRLKRQHVAGLEIRNPTVLMSDPLCPPLFWLL